MLKYLKCVLVCSAIFLAGCTYYVEEPIPYKTARTSSAGSDSSVNPDMFASSQIVEDDSLGDAIMIREKYEQTKKENTALQNDNRELKKKVSDLELELAKTQSDLNRAEKEIKQANEFMTQMNKELVRWKSDVLGYRKETRTVQKAQLQALAKILKALGAEEDESQTQALEGLNAY